ncbi:MAG: tyrosine--tRNA ligase [Gammaproteobacteria bacterium]|nr:MAG: tyrosine--tRNA ligase [Gammaproteobacteria bacterium]
MSEHPPAVAGPAAESEPALAPELPPPGDLLADLRWRGLIAQTTDGDALAAALASGPVTLYCGFDPTAPSLHVGNLVPLLTLRRFQLAGHRPIGLVGGATGLIGDPSGRSAERSLAATDVVEGWVALIRGQLEVVLDFEGATATRIVSNLEWTRNLSAIELLRDVGKHFSVNAMLAKESVSARLAGEGISYTEFSYMILQSYDYLELYRGYGCTLQIGGSDQWGNITSGLDLIRRVAGHDGPKAHALTVPLVTKADGTKFGKTAGGAVWLSPELTSPYAFYQYWINTDDRDIARFLRMFSLKPPTEIVGLEADSAARPAARIAQRALALELTALIHGDAEALRVEEASRALFGRGDSATLDAQTLAAALTEAPHSQVPARPAPVVDLLVACGLCDSKGAARRAIAEGGAYVNNVRVTDVAAQAGPDDALAGGWLLLRRGKRAIGGVRFAD